MLVRNDLHVSRIQCSVPNVCIVDIKGNEDLRIIGVYAPASKSWSWDDLSIFVLNKCVIFGDFNVDISEDDSKAESLLKWADDQFLAPFLPDSPTSLLSDRVIDFAFIRGTTLSIQTYRGNTTSDHVPIIGVIPFDIKYCGIGKNVHWNVFTFFTEYTFSFWKEIWNLENIDDLYNDYSKFLFLLSARCTTFFPLEKYRQAIPSELRAFLSYIRALSFRQLRTKCSLIKKEVSLLKNVAKHALKSFFSSQLSSVLLFRNTSSPASVSFWSKTKKFLKPSSSSLHAFIAPSGQIVKDDVGMCEVAADYYENFFKKSVIIRPHPYTDSPLVEFDNAEEVIPEVTTDELLLTVKTRRQKNLLMLMVFLVICLIFLIIVIGRYFLIYSIIHFVQQFFRLHGKNLE